jgi:peptidoglycan LD-endopeptidase LytH
MRPPPRPTIALLAGLLAITTINACSSDTASTTASSTTPATATPATTAPASTTTTTTTTYPATTTATTTTTITEPQALVYVFPFTGRNVSYGTTHHDYPAVDVFGCGANVVAPTSGRVLEISRDDRWDPSIDDPATRGGHFVSMLGDDNVRYYFAHLDSVAVEAGDTVAPGTQLGVMGQTGNARNSACHTHVGFSWNCDAPEWQVRRGEVWPQQYLDAWRSETAVPQNAEGRSPSTEVAAAEAAAPTACAEAIALVG